VEFGLKNKLNRLFTFALPATIAAKLFFVSVDFASSIYSTATSPDLGLYGMTRMHRFATVGLLMAGFLFSNSAFAVNYEPGTVFNYSTKTWEKPRAGGKFRSNKSPIARKKIDFDENVAVGTIVIDTSDRRLYHVIAEGTAMAYGIGVGRDGFQWQGKKTISRKAEWPDWRPPAVMRARVLKKEGRVLPVMQPGGPDNPLGARAMYLGGSIYRIHGTNQPWTIGQAMSSGCFRMANDDVTYLYDQVEVGTKVIIRE
jgi:lipoprotein-anchoring transpeptidase ErfK/SrfK